MTGETIRKSVRYLGQSLSLMVLVFLSSCQPHPPAEWITIAGDAGKPGQWICFRKIVDIPDSIVNETARIAVDSKYMLWINDSLIVRDGELIRDVNPRDTYYDEMNIGPFLKKGRNVIAILVNYYGRDGLNHHSSGKAGLYFDSPHIVSDATWKVKRHPAFYSLADTWSNYRYAPQDVGFNASLDIGWTGCHFDDSEWDHAAEAGPPPVAPWHRLVRRPVPMVKDYGLKPYIKTYRQGDTVVACLPYDAQVMPFFRIRSESYDTIRIFSDTYSLGNRRHHNGLMTEYICSGGTDKFEVPQWISGQKIYYVMPPDVDILRLGYRETGYNTTFAADFNCDDPFLNTLWEKARRTLYVCMRDYYMDCPDRERSQYGADACNMMNQSFFAFDTAVYALDRKSILNVFNWQRSDSTIYMPYGGWFSEELPLQMLAFTGYHGIYQYFLYSGDTATIRAVFPAMEKYHALWNLESDGLVHQRKGDWYWVDWGTNIDARLLDNVWYADALKGDILLAHVLGLQKEEASLSHKYEQLKRAVNQYYWNGEEYRSAGYTGPADDRGNALAVLSGIADSSKYEKIAAILTRNEFASPYTERFVLDALFTMNQTGSALQRMKSRYGSMVLSPYTTLWEQWEYISPAKSTSSYNHGWSGSPLHLLPQYVAGIKPVEPGFSRYEIIPKLQGLHRVSCRVETARGEINLKIDSEDWQFLTELYSPPGTVARVGVPKEFYHNVLKVNGRIIRNNLGRKNRDVERATITGEDTDYIYLELNPGKWLIESF